MYVKHCKLPRTKQLELMKYFVASVTARTAADLTGIHRNSAIRFLHKLRSAIAHTEQERAAQFTGEIKLDESYFGGTRKGKRGRGAAGKVAVFGLLKRRGHVYTQIIIDAKKDTLMPIIRQKSSPTALSTPIVGVDIMHWMCQNLSTIVSIIPSCLQISAITSTKLKIF